MEPTIYTVVITTTALVVSILLWFCYWLLQKGGYLGGNEDEQD